MFKDKENGQTNYEVRNKHVTAIELKQMQDQYWKNKATEPKMIKFFDDVDAQVIKSLKQVYDFIKNRK